jgi:glycerol-3-phosphate acyltransferase PlsY
LQLVLFFAGFFFVFVSCFVVLSQACTLLKQLTRPLFVLVTYMFPSIAFVFPFFFVVVVLVALFFFRHAENAKKESPFLHREVIMEEYKAKHGHYPH